MAMNKKEQAALADAQREVKLHQLCVLLPALEPDLLPPACRENRVVHGWNFNSHRNSQRIFPAMSSATQNRPGSHDELDPKNWRRGPMPLYSTKELATEAMKRAVVRRALSELLDSLERE